MYIHERDNWTDFRWDMSQVSLLQEKVFRKQGLLYGRLSSLGFDSKLRAMAENLTYDVELVDALDEAGTIVTTILNKSFFWQKASAVPMTERQTQMLNLFLDGYEAKITSKTWATLAKCSKDTAIRDIQDLVDKNILIENIPGAKRPSYSIVYDAEDLSQFFTEVSISEENGIPYLKAIFKGKKTVSERLLKLDAERFKKGDLPLSNLLSKYCSYIVVSNRE
jgi:hypothetical protein